MVFQIKLTEIFKYKILSLISYTCFVLNFYFRFETYFSENILQFIFCILYLNYSFLFINHTILICVCKNVEM